MALTAQQFVESLTVHGLMSSGEVTTLLKEWTVVGGNEPDVEALVRKLVQEGKLTKFQAINLYQGRGKGLILGEYLILDKIGAGAMGKVYKAKHRRMHRIVALKVLPPHVSAMPRIIDRFFREVQVAARLTHPNVVAAYDSGESHGLHYLVMEYVEGQDLLAYADANAPLAVATAVELLRQSAEGLAYAHEQNIVHRDVKPSNILVTADGQAKILDLGLARITEDDASDTGETQNVLTVEGEVMGTPDYMSPGAILRHACGRPSGRYLCSGVFFISDLSRTHSVSGGYAGREGNGASRSTDSEPPGSSSGGFRRT